MALVDRLAVTDTGNEKALDAHVAEAAGHLWVVLGTHVVGALGSLAAVSYLFFKGDEASSTLVFVIYLCISNFAFLAGVAVITIAYRNAAAKNSRLRDLRTKLESAAREYETRAEAETGKYKSINSLISKDRMVIAYVHTDLCTELLKAATGKISDDAQEVTRNVNLCFERYLDRILESTQRLFTHYTGHVCAATIKFFEAEYTNQDGRKGSVWTLKRDPGSAQERGVIDERLERYPYYHNTAFYNIYSLPNEPDFYVKDGLKRLYDAGGYKTDNGHWSSYYDAVAVVPIRPSGKDVLRHCVGFLCVDNIGGGFERESERCVHILNGIASDLYYAISTAIILLGKLEYGSVHHG